MVWCQKQKSPTKAQHLISKGCRVGGSMREKRRGVWELRVYLGRDHDDKVQHRQVTFRGGKRDAQRELNRLVVELEFGGETRDQALRAAAAAPDWGPKTTFNDALEGWRLNGWGDLSANTTKRYRSLWDVHIRSSIGPERIAATGPYEVERFLRAMKGAGQSKSSVHQTRAMLHRACRLARKWSGNLLPNPVSDTELPEWKLGEQPAEQRCPAVDEVRAILAAAAAEDLRLATFIRVVAATGARRGEICALRWSDIDSSVPSIVLDEATVADRGVAIKGPKSRASIRRVAIDGGTLALLQDLRVEREAIAADCELTVDAEGFVFSTDPSTVAPPHPDGMTQAFRRIRERAGVASDIHLHSLRHFQSTQLDPVISEAQKQARLGWATVQMARHYTGRITEEDFKAAAHIGGVLGETPVGSSPSNRRSALRFHPPGTA
jgi:integrase